MAEITYHMEYMPHPWNEKHRANGISVWALVQRTTPELSAGGLDIKNEPIAVFNLDSEARTFQAHLFLMEMRCQPPVVISESERGHCDSQLKRSRK